jgi:hypothetical protein
MNGARAAGLPNFCRSQLCTVLHSHAVCNGRDDKGTTLIQLQPGRRGFECHPGASSRWVY